MKKSILLASLFLAFAALAGCAHPADITDDVALVAASTAQS
jgi:hypothetical protein